MLRMVLAMALSAFAADSALAAWLARETGQTVSAMEVEGLFPGLKNALPQDRAYCLPLLGALLRT